MKYNIYFVTKLLKFLTIAVSLAYCLLHGANAQYRLAHDVYLEHYCEGDAYARIMVDRNAGHEFIWRVGGNVLATMGHSISLSSDDFGKEICVKRNCTCAIPFEACFTFNPEDFAFDAEVITQNATCNGLSDGKAKVVTLQTGVNYSYTWDGKGGTTQVENLSAGGHKLIVKNNLGCSKEIHFEIAEPKPLNPSSYSIRTDSVRCHGGKDGSAEIQLAHISYLSVPSIVWSNGLKGNKTTGLEAGKHTVRIQTEESCGLAFFEIHQPSRLEWQLESPPLYHGFNFRCHDSEDGVLSLSVHGGTGSYEVGFLSHSFTHVAPNTILTQEAIKDKTFEVFVSDQHGCEYRNTVQLKAPDALSGGFQLEDFEGGVNIRCKGDQSGFVRFIPSGGVPAYTYEWKNEKGIFLSEGEQLDGIGAGAYTVKVLDAHGCQRSFAVELKEPQSPVTLDLVRVARNRIFNLSVVKVIGGTPGGYRLNGQMKKSKILLAFGSSEFRVVAEDANSCSEERMFELHTQNGQTATRRLVEEIKDSIARLGKRKGRCPKEVRLNKGELRCPKFLSTKRKKIQLFH